MFHNVLNRLIILCVLIASCSQVPQDESFAPPRPDLDEGDTVVQVTEVPSDYSKVLSIVYTQKDASGKEIYAETIDEDGKLIEIIRYNSYSGCYEYCDGNGTVLFDYSPSPESSFVPGDDYTYVCSVDSLGRLTSERYVNGLDSVFVKYCYDSSSSTYCWKEDSTKHYGGITQVIRRNHHGDCVLSKFITSHDVSTSAYEYVYDELGRISRSTCNDGGNCTIKSYDYYSYGDQLPNVERKAEIEIPLDDFNIGAVLVWDFHRAFSLEENEIDHLGVRFTGWKLENGKNYISYMDKHGIVRSYQEGEDRNLHFGAKSVIFYECSSGHFSYALIDRKTAEYIAKYFGLSQNSVDELLKNECDKYMLYKAYEKFCIAPQDKVGQALMDKYVKMHR